MGSGCFRFKAVKANFGTVGFLQGDPMLLASFRHVQVIEMFLDNCWLCLLNVIYQGKASAVGISVNRTV